MNQNQTWEQANEWERQWHGDCINSYNEETKQYIYATHMGLDIYKENFYGRKGYDFGNKNILDMGCGPYSILLKSTAKLKVAIDPCNYPLWVRERYKAADVDFLNIKGEDFFESRMIFDEGLLYNCLQHTEDPEKIIKNMLNHCRIIRVFEWVDTGVSDGHLHDLKEDKLNEWLEGEGVVKYLTTSPASGKAYFGIFNGNINGIY
jgi:2-polyprenyl-3-methyl-5-hydroxy-6-metoxy-1,4-benzoquinol methylase